jgi:ABC-type lipoprotein export system ATPase subunit
MNEKVSIEFTGEEFDQIMQYMKLIDAVTVQTAVMNAISIAMDDAEQ